MDRRRSRRQSPTRTSFTAADVPSSVVVEAGRTHAAPAAPEVETAPPPSPSGVPSPSVAARFWAKVDKSAGPDACWPWLGGIYPGGYGYFGQGQASGTSAGRRAHRISYELVVGPIPEGYQIDHLCHDPADCTLCDECPHRRCVNPTHLKAVTPRENTLRSGSFAAVLAVKTHCLHGHPFDEANTYLARRGRECRVCRREAKRRFDQKAKNSGVHSPSVGGGAVLVSPASSAASTNDARSET